LLLIRCIHHSALIIHHWSYMLIIPPPKPVKKQPKIRPPTVVPAPPGLPLMLQEGTYFPDTGILQLFFHRAVDLSGFNGAAFLFKDGVTHFLTYTANGSTVEPDGNGFNVGLTAGGAYTGGDTLLTVSALSGIKAVDDGGTWAGVVDLELPFG
jgi:hypothetical protein